MKRVSVLLSADDGDAVELIHEAVIFLKGTLERQQRGLGAEQGAMLDRMEEITAALKSRHAEKFALSPQNRTGGRTVPVLRI